MEKRGRGKVYLVSRSEYEMPLGHRVDVFDSPDLLTWFQENWASESLEEILARKGGDETGHQGSSAFCDVFGDMQENKPPRSWKALKTFLADCYTEGSIQFTEHAIQSITDDDEIDKAWYLFDEEFAKSNPQRASYLLHDGWKLDLAVADVGSPPPAVKTVIGQPARSNGIGHVHCVFISARDGMTILDMTGNFRFDGLRLPEFRNFLCESEIPSGKAWDGREKAAWPEELLLLRAALLRSGPVAFDQVLEHLDGDRINAWLPLARPMSDLRFELKEPRLLAGDPEQCRKDFDRLTEAISREDTSSSYWRHEMVSPLVQTSPHFCQIRFREKTSDRHGSLGHYRCWSWFFFDDLWIGAHPQLAESLLRYSAGWDVLCDDQD